MADTDLALLPRRATPTGSATAVRAALHPLAIGCVVAALTVQAEFAGAAGQAILHRPVFSLGELGIAGAARVVGLGLSRDDALVVDNAIGVSRVEHALPVLAAVLGTCQPIDTTAATAAATVRAAFEFVIIASWLAGRGLATPFDTHLPPAAIPAISPAAVRSALLQIARWSTLALAVVAQVARRASATIPATAIAAALLVDTMGNMITAEAVSAEGPRTAGLAVVHRGPVELGEAWQAHLARIVLHGGARLHALGADSAPQRLHQVRTLVDHAQVLGARQGVVAGAATAPTSVGPALFAEAIRSTAGAEITVVTDLATGPKAFLELALAFPVQALPVRAADFPVVYLAEEIRILNGIAILAEVDRVIIAILIASSADQAADSQAVETTAPFALIRGARQAIVTITTLALTAIVTALLATAIGSANALAVDAGFLDVLTVATNISAAIIAADLVLTCRLADASTLQALVLVAGTHTTHALTPIVATLSSLTLGYTLAQACRIADVVLGAIPAQGIAAIIAAVLALAFGNARALATHALLFVMTTTATALTPIVTALLAVTIGLTVALALQAGVLLSGTFATGARTAIFPAHSAVAIGPADAHPGLAAGQQARAKAAFLTAAVIPAVLSRTVRQAALPGQAHPLLPAVLPFVPLGAVIGAGQDHIGRAFCHPGLADYGRRHEVCPSIDSDLRLHPNLGLTLDIGSSRGGRVAGATAKD